MIQKFGWGNEISSSFPNSNVQIKERYDFAFTKSKPNYLLLNYESFQLDSSKELIDSLIQNFKVDMIILDEIHSTKSNSNVESKKKKLINYFLLEAEKKNKNLHVSGMSATPVVNDLSEAVSLIEMIKGKEYPELDTEPKISNALSIHEQLVINGIRYMPNYKMHLSEKNIEITDQSIIQDLMQIGRGQLLKIEQAFFKLKKKQF